jgi:hypothetical protein
MISEPPRSTPNPGIPIPDLGEHAEEAARRPAKLALQVEEAAWDVVSTRNARDDEPGPFFTVESFHRGFSQEPFPPTGAPRTTS